MQPPPYHKAPSRASDLSKDARPGRVLSGEGLHQGIQAKKVKSIKGEFPCAGPRPKVHGPSAGRGEDAPTECLPSVTPLRA